MSLTAAFQNASSGLTVALKAASVTSSNLANSLTEGYGRREISVSARAIGGVLGSTTRREVDLAVLSDLRLATATSAGLARQSSDLDRIERVIGAADDPNGIGALYTRVETALIAVAARPEDAVRREALATSAGDLSEKISKASSALQSMRRDADKELATEVALLNRRLAEVAQTNKALLASGGKDTSALLDRRQVLIDQIATQVPIKTLQRDNGTVALITPKGQFLLNDLAFPAKFEPTGMISAEMRVEEGSLDQITVLNHPLRLDGEGKIGALLQLRDQLAPKAQIQLDDLAADLAQRSGFAGLPLFTLPDPGSAIDLRTDTTLLQERYATNPAQFHRDVSSLIGALQSESPTPFGPQSMAQHAANLTDARALAAHSADLARTSSAAESTALAEIMAQGGVDTDHELQSLLKIEKFFAANAKALQVLDQIHSDLLKLG